MKATTILALGKEAQDVIQAWIDPAMTKGKLAEAQDLGVNLWNLQDKYPEIKGHLKEFIAWTVTGAQLETMKEYFTADGWIEWDLNLFVEEV